jgi:hypothetical protein
MAILYPDIDIIKKSKVPPTDGELKLLTFLNQKLDNSYEIFFQPFLNGDNPDIVVMRKGSGVIIFEVKDWNLRHYYIDDKTKWKLKQNDSFIKSPLTQVDEYKENLYNLHIDTLLEKKIRNKYYLAVVSCAVYFHNETESSLKKFLLDGFQSDEYKRYRKFVNYFTLLGSDSLNHIRLNELLQKTRINQQSQLFSDDLYESFKRYLKPPYHKLEEGIEIKYTREQNELISSKAGAKQKIKGVAGSGKTLVLAKRAVNAHKRTGEKILILTFNLSLKNYIHDRINDVRENFYWDNFYITNYHQFFKSQANNHNIPIRSLEAWQDTDFFDGVKNRVQKFGTILIDEVQDYQTEWLEIITKYFLAYDGEFIVFGDEKQNIYDRPLDENKEPIIKTVVGRWNRSLSASKRFTSNIANVAKQFQTEFFNSKYNLDEFTITQTELDFETKAIEYYYFAENWTVENVCNTMLEVIKKYSITPSNIGVLNSKVEYIRELDHLLRQKTNEKTKTTFETQEVYDHLKKEINQNNKDKDEKQLQKILNEKLEDIRKHKKNHFWMNTGTMKLSTIHSFKGWEIHSLFLLIENEDGQNEFGTNELIYTGLTRARANLFIFNLGNDKYDNFFKRYADNCYNR